MNLFVLKGGPQDGATIGITGEAVPFIYVPVRACENQKDARWNDRPLPKIPSARYRWNWQTERYTFEAYEKAFTGRP